MVSTRLEHRANYYTIVDQALTEFPPFERHDGQLSDKHDSPFEFTFEDHFEEYHNNYKSEMAGAGSPYIKPEPNDLHFNFNNFGNGQQQDNGFNMGSQHHNNFNIQRNGVDPNQISQSGSYSQNMSSSYLIGNSGIGDDELMDLAGNTHDVNGQNQFQQGQMFGDVSGMNQQSNYYSPNAVNGMTMSIPQQSIYSSTPEGAPIQSPFVNDFNNYAHFRTPSTGHHQHMNMATSGSGFANSLMRAQHMQNMERKISETRSPASPNTSAMTGLHIGEPEYPTPNMQQQMMNHRHSASLAGNNWDGTTNGVQSWNEGSPFPSPNQGHLNHQQIDAVLGSGQGKVASSLPAKMEPGVAPPSYQTQEAKKRRRRESHNLVERRRRDNINERIHDLANLIPGHRLDDDKVRKHLQTNSPLSPSITAASMSPPAATSLLASSGGRRAASGSITQGLPIEDKDKGPNKGDILNGSVSWARDVVWYMHLKLQQEAQLKDYITSLGGQWPFDVSEDERRMHSELVEVVSRNELQNNIQSYSRTHGSGLRVPGHTNMAGDLEPSNKKYGNGSSLSPTFGASNGNDWQFNNFKEEDEFDDML